MISLSQQSDQGTPCDFSTDENPSMTTIEMSYEDVQAQVQGNPCELHYSHFKFSDILTMINNNPDCKFLRVYNALGPDGNYIHLIVPVLTTGYDKQEPGTLYFSGCCACPPNCKT